MGFDVIGKRISLTGITRLKGSQVSVAVTESSHVSTSEKNNLLPKQRSRNAAIAVKERLLGDVVEPFIRIVIVQAKSPASNFVELLDLIDGRSIFGAIHRPDVINGAF